MSEIKYALSETVVRVGARSVTVTDPYENGGVPRTVVENLKIETVNVADDNDRATVELIRGDREVSATLGPDGRLRSLEYNSTGVGSQVVTGVAKLVAFVGSVALAVARGGRPAGGDGSNQSRVQPPDVDKDWERDNSSEEKLRKDYLEVYRLASDQLVSLRKEIVNSADPTSLRVLHSRVAAVELVTKKAGEEVQRIVQLKSVWRESKRVSVASDLQTVVRFTDIPRREATDLAPPATTDLEGVAAELWRDFGILLEERATRRDVARPAGNRGSSSSSSEKGPDWPSNVRGAKVIWRVPREVELWVWKRGPKGLPTLSQRETIWICDEQSEQREMLLTSALFGEHGGSLTFNDDGQPGTLLHKQQSAVGAVMTALGGVPEAIAGSVAKAKETAEALSALRDLEAERARSTAARDLEIAKNRLELAGIHATADDYAELQRAKQAVELQKTRKDLAPAVSDPIEDLKRELEAVTTQNKIATERRSAEFDLELAEMRAEVAKLQLEVKRKKAYQQLGEPN